MPEAKSSCPICGNPSAPNAFPDDPRCGPCHNFRIEGFTKYGGLIVRVDFEEWAAKTVSDIERADNMATYRLWLHALRLAQARRERGDVRDVDCPKTD